MVGASALPCDDILEGDCLAAMARLPSGSIDLVFAGGADLRRLEIDTSYFVFNATPEVSVLGAQP